MPLFFKIRKSKKTSQNESKTKNKHGTLSHDVSDGLSKVQAEQTHNAAKKSSGQICHETKMGPELFVLI